MKLSLRGEYALRALVVLGLNYGKAVVRIQTISEQQNVPKRFLEQILNDLKSAGVVESKRGVAGGERVGKGPSQRLLAGGGPANHGGRRAGGFVGGEHFCSIASVKTQRLS